MIPLSTFATMQADDPVGQLSSPTASRWLSVVTHLDPRYGGLSSVVPQLSSIIQEKHHVSMSMAAFCAPGELYSPANFAEILLTEWPAGRGIWLRNRGLNQRFQHLLDSTDGVHVHGLWEQSTLMACRGAQSRQVPYIVSAHGMLDPWALRNKRLKKVLYSALIERANLAKASCLHALTSAEADDYRRFGCTSPIAVIPNGVRVPEQVSSRKFLSQHPALQGKRIVLFLGRIHFKKGLDLLIRAWREIIVRWPDAHLVLAGPDFEGTRAQISKLVEEHGLDNHVLFTGMLRDDLKWSALAAAECFVLPSYSEGLSISVLEAMGVGLPVIVSDHCNLPEISDLDAGWVIPATVTSLQNALRAVFANSPQDNAAIGQRGRDFVSRRYNWSKVASQIVEVYRWVQGGPMPTAVDLRIGERP